MATIIAQNRLKSILGHLWAQQQPAEAPPPATAAIAPVVKPAAVNRHELSPTYFLPRAAAIEPHAEAIVYTTANGKVLRRSYIEFADRARGLAYYIKKHAFKRVGVLCPNTPCFLECLFGIPAGGAVQVGVNYRLKKEDVHYIFTHSEVDMIVVDREYLGLLEGFDPRVKIVVDDDTDCTEGELSGEFDAVILEGLREDIRAGSKGWDALEMEAQDEDSLIALAYTSGTTARPKGCEFTHRGVYLAALANMIESGLNTASPMPSSRAKYLTILPLFHAVGWTFPWAVVGARATHHCLRKVDYPEIWRLLKEERITHFNAAPTVNTLLCNAEQAERLPQQVRVTVAASPPTAKLFEDMIKLNLLPVHVYGLTETYGPITKCYFDPSWHHLPADEMYRRMAIQGHGFITSHLVKVIKPDTPGAIPVARNGQEIGEVVCTGNICIKGYHKDPEATAKLFESGVLHSGDLALWHEDGSIQILDRAKDIIISGGENISSVSLESALITHPSILEVGVVAVADSHYGERPKAFVTIKHEAKVGGLTGEDVVKWARCNPKIAGFMVPREVEIVEELPKTSTGKIRKNVLREWVRGQRAV